MLPRPRQSSGLGGDANPRPNPCHDSNDRRQPRCVDRRALSAGSWCVGTTGIGGLARRTVRQALGSNAGVHRGGQQSAVAVDCDFSGEHYQLPLPDGPGKPLKLTIAPISEHIPIYLAAVGPKNLELAGELADGWLAIFYAPEFAPEQLDKVRSGRARVGKDLVGFDVVPSVPLVVGADPRICADQVRGYAALYLGGMGSREKNFYNELAVRMGFGETAAMVQDLFLSRRHRDAMAAVPFDFIDQTSLLGDRDRIADGLQLLAGSGVTTCALVPYGGSVEEKINALTVAAEALERSGVGS